MKINDNESAHLDPEELAAYVDGGLNAIDAARVEAHMASCDDCRRLFIIDVGLNRNPTAAEYGQMIKEELAEEPMPPLKPPVSRKTGNTFRP